MMRMRRIAAVTVLALALAATGCANSDAGGSKRDDSTGGSVSSKKLPQDARRVAEATGGRLVHRPLRDGNVFVVDGETEKVIYSGPVRGGANVVVDPAANAVTVNDQQVKPSVALQPRHTYRLYFEQK
jgi:hypothetical protein